MSVVTFFSAKGAPGATTAAMLAASLWPRPALLVDCDPAGGDVGLRLPDPNGRPLDLNRGLLSLLPMARRTLVPESLVEHAQEVLGGGRVLVGVSGPDQAVAGGPVWETIATSFAAQTDYDVIVDAGRVDQRSPVLPVLQRSDLVVSVLGTSLANTYSTRARLRALLLALSDPAGGPRLGVVVRSGDARDAERAAQVIQAESEDARWLGHLAEDPVGAGIFDGRPVGRPERTLLVRSGRSVVDEILREIWRSQLLSTDPAQQPWNTLTGEFAAYQPYLARDGAPSGTAPSGTAPGGAEPEPRRSRVEERKNEQRRTGGRQGAPTGRLRRRRAERSEPGGG